MGAAAAAQTTARGGALAGEGSRDVARPWASRWGPCLGPSDPSLHPSLTDLPPAGPALCPVPPARSLSLCVRDRATLAPSGQRGPLGSVSQTLIRTSLHRVLPGCQVLPQHLVCANPLTGHHSTVTPVLVYPYFADRKTEALKVPPFHGPGASSRGLRQGASVTGGWGGDCWEIWLPSPSTARLQAAAHPGMICPPSDGPRPVLQAEGRVWPAGSR